MAAEAAGNGPPPFHPGPPVGILPTHPHRASHVQPDPGSSSQSVFGRPLLYVPPPPPPLLHYQWPMPFSYSPFGGFPGMGYGMVMPPFPPPTFMEAPAYILPHSHMQPVDYRRLQVPQFHIPGPPLPNPSLSRQGQMTQTVHARQTVNTEVQTELTQNANGSDEVGSDSGHGTASNLSSPSNSSSRKQLEDDILSSQLNGPCTSRGVDQSGRTVNKTIETASQSILRETHMWKHKKGIGQEPSYKKTCDVQSQGSVDGVLPVCSSSQTEDETVEGRRVSVPDILMLTLPQDDHQLPSDEMKQRDKSQSETTNGPLTVIIHEAEELFSSKILRLPSSPDFKIDEDPVNLAGSVRSCLTYRNALLHSLSLSLDSPEDKDETSLHEDTAEIHHMSFSSGPLRRRLNESIWSVESLEPFIPNRDWLLQHGMFPTEMIFETEKNKNGPTTQDTVLHREKGQISSPPDSVAVLESRLVLSTPTQRPGSPKKLQVESDFAGMRAQDTSSPSKERDVQEDGHAELCPDQVFLPVSEPQIRSPTTSVGGMFLIPEVEEETSLGRNREDVENEVGSQWRNKDLQVPPADVTLSAISPSKGPSVDCGIQSTEQCACGRWIRPQPTTSSKPSDGKRANDNTTEVTDGRLARNSRRTGNWKSRNQERNGSQQEAYGGNCFKPGKLKGANARNSRY